MGEFAVSSKLVRRRQMIVALTAVILPVVPVATPAARAEPTVQCATSAPVYTVRATGGLWLYQHLEPETGINSWGPQQQINTFGADAKRLAAPDGVIYSITNTGEFRRRRWNGAGWDTFAGGAQYEVIDSNPAWAGYTTPDYFNRITVDTNGDIYSFESDNFLHWRSYNTDTRSWAHRKLERMTGTTGVVAAGKGVIYTYSSSTSLRRFEYDRESQRSQSWSVTGIGQSAMRQIFSPGADILYGVRADTGDLLWYRYDPETFTWANGVVNGQAVGMPIGTGWQNEYETFAAPDGCLLLGRNPWPTRPQITPRPWAPVTLTVDGSLLQYSYVDTEGRAVYAEATDLTGGTPIRLAAVPGMTDITGVTSTTLFSDDRAVIFANGLDGEGHGNTQTAPGGAS